MTAAVENSGATIAGYVEAITADAALGWVWQPDQPNRLRVQLRRGEILVAEAIADGLRQDLAQNGIGDGRHAFILPIPDKIRGQPGSLQVLAILENGTEIPIEAAPVAMPASARMAQLQKGLDMLIASQRLLHRNLQAALLQPSANGPLTEIAASQAKLQQALETVELFAIRLEQQSAAVAPQARPPAGTRALACVAGLSVAALIVSAVSLLHSLVVN
ncbi:MAG: hypothetical protein RQ966_12725 [Acetobacteraceae bacterium]|nr:hypothetical protein [Acetobacteraceae bacterium]